MNEALLYQILLTIAKQMPYAEQVRQLKTFAVIQDIEDIKNMNLETTQLNFKKGLFWDRDWVAQGAIESERQRNYPLLVVRRISISSDNDRTKKRSYCQKFQIAVFDIDTKDESCNDCGRTIEEIKTGCFNILHTVKYNLLNTKRFNTNLSSVWATQNEIDYLIAQNIITSAEEDYQTQSIEQLIKNISDFRFLENPIDSGYGVEMFFDLCGCAIQPLPLNYAYTEGVTNIPNLECEMC